MAIELDKGILSNFDSAASREWIETNGLGGWSSSSVSGANTRNYHGIFVSAVNPPVERVVMLNKLEEIISIAGKKYELSCNQFPGKVVCDGLPYLNKFSRDIFPVFQYKIDNLEITKTIASIYQEDTVVITYEVTSADGEFELDLKPMISFRDYHSLSQANDSINRIVKFGDSTLEMKPYSSMPPLYIHVDKATFGFNPAWFHNFEYREEQSRGLRFSEDLFCYGNFTVKLKAGSKLGIVISTLPDADKDAFKRIQKEKERREALLTKIPVKDLLSRTLILAADQFLVKRGEDLKTIIAGYHWFADWGRDTMIALPGICLINERYDDAKKILKAFAQSIDHGMLPNRFSDRGEAPEYNTADATLWFFVAIKKYLDYSGDEQFVLEELLPALKNIVEYHDAGTRYNIAVQEDGLIYQGQVGMQLTWMDAKIGDWVVTPRIGKAVEINALWYNALLIMSELSQKAKNEHESTMYRERAEKVKTAFMDVFLHKEKGYLYDCIRGDYKDASFRPNQIFAMSLPYSLLDRELSSSILKMIEEKLLTPFGLRSLAPDDPKYIGHYRGDQLSRDGAYHQGTVWSWLLGPYITAKIRLEGEEGRRSVMKLLNKFQVHLHEAGVGTVSEIFDGDAPFEPKGCIAQAWGVSEILRAYFEDLYSLDNSRVRSRVEMKGILNE
ncbi:MAG: amylo-alpha-1,6-glucosidase [Cytophagaceae bacterium]